jgi:hypothetical protein
VSGAFEVAGATVFVPPSCASVAGCPLAFLGGTLMMFDGGNRFIAGTQQFLYGVPVNTPFNETLQSMGMTPEAARFTENLVGLAGFGMSAASAFRTPAVVNVGSGASLNIIDDVVRTPGSLNTTVAKAEGSVVREGAGAAAPLENATTNTVVKILEKATPTTGHPNQLMAVLEDGTRVIFRKDFGTQAHTLGGPFQGKGQIDHYNIQIQIPKPNGHAATIENIHVVPD